MNRVIMSGLLLASAAVLVVADEAQLQPTTRSIANSTNLLQITGMTCDACAKGVASELRRLPGVVSASVSFSNKLAVVAIDTNRVSEKTLLTTIEEAGYSGTSKP